MERRRIEGGWSRLDVYVALALLDYERRGVAASALLVGKGVYRVDVTPSGNPELDVKRYDALDAVGAAAARGEEVDVERAAKALGYTGVIVVEADGCIAYIFH